MVVIVFVEDPKGRSKFPAKKVTYCSRVIIEPDLFSAQVEPGETYATTKEGKCTNYFLFTHT